MVMMIWGGLGHCLERHKTEVGVARARRGWGVCHLSVRARSFCSRWSESAAILVQPCGWNVDVVQYLDMWGWMRGLEFRRAVLGPPDEVGMAGGGTS